MKKLTAILPLVLFLFIVSCKKEVSNDLGGDTNIPLNQVGNTFTVSTSINGSWVDIPFSWEISKSDNGVATFDVLIDLTSVPEFAMINDLIPDQYKDSQGRINTQIRAKITSEGILDYTNLDQAPFTMVKYDASVGDKYSLSKSDGKTITRTVTQKSETDDFEWGFYLIKTITVEQDSRIPGISKIIYKFNHKFGLVFVEAVAEDGSSFSSLVYPANY